MGAIVTISYENPLIPDMFFDISNILSFLPFSNFLQLKRKDVSISVDFFFRTLWWLFWDEGVVLDEKKYFDDPH